MAIQRLSVRLNYYCTYQHQCLISVFEEGQILELNKPYGDVALIDEEACEKHEWNDQDWSKGHCQLLI